MCVEVVVKRRKTSAYHTNIFPQNVPSKTFSSKHFLKNISPEPHFTTT
jgi:hypothetical protein